MKININGRKRAITIPKYPISTEVISPLEVIRGILIAKKHEIRNSKYPSMNIFINSPKSKVFLKLSL